MSGPWNGRKRTSTQVQQKLKAILCFNDDELVLVSIHRAIETLGYQIMTIHHPEHVLWFASDQHLDLIMSDFHMPQMDGYEFFQRLRNGLKKNPFMMLTADQAKTKLFERGCMAEPWYRSHDVNNEFSTC